MRTKLTLALFGLLLSAWGAVAQSPTPEQLNLLRQLPQDQQSALLQSILGKGDTSGRKTDPKLQTPETVQPKDEESDQYQRDYKEKTSDGRRLRRPCENPELRADDDVLIDLTPIDRTATRSRSDAGGMSTAGAGAGAVATFDANTSGWVTGCDSSTGASSVRPHGNNGEVDADLSESYGRVMPDQKPPTDEEMKKIQAFRERVLRNNPYRLNRFGVLELPGIPSIPLAGLTAAEATTRLSADPDLRDYVVKVTLLRLKQYGEESLKPFGYDLFEGVPSTFAPVSDIQVPTDYVVGPGDTLNVQLYGNEPATYTLTVGRDGQVSFPKLGPIRVSGMSFDGARAEIERRVAQQLIGTRVSVTMGDLRSIRVFVLGEAEKPGSYTVSGLSSMTNALFVSGGVKKIGSLRNIELKRNGRSVTTLDLYDLLLRGDNSADRQLLPGDVIFIPPIGKTVSINGAVRRPAIYELKGEKSVAQAIEMAGGLNADADETRVQLERILPSQLRQMRDIDLTSSQSGATELWAGDKLQIPIIRPTLENSVILAGFVYRPGAFQYHKGLRLSEILNSFDELRPTADKHYIMIRREVPPEERVEVLSADLERALAAPGSAADPELRPRDKITVFDLSASRDRIVAPVIHDLELQASPQHLAQVVTVDGKVNSPGRYPLEPNMHVSDLIRAGGSLDDAAFSGEAELTRYEVVDGKARESELIPLNLDSIRQGVPGADVMLKPYDVLLIKPTPLWDTPGTIELSGEVRFPGRYPIHRGETLHSVMQRAGGFTDLAFVYGAVFIREELKQREKDQIDVLAIRMQSDLAALSLEAVGASAATSNSNAAAGAASALAIGQQLVAQLKETKPVGRLVIDLGKIVRGPPGIPDDVGVRDGDRLLIPKRNQEITILGEVQSPTSHVYQAGLTRDDYIGKSGGITPKADRKHIYIVRANGDVVTGQRQGWFQRSQDIKMQPGDVIVVPLDTERIRPLPLWQAVTTIVYNLAVALLAIRNVN